MPRPTERGKNRPGASPQGPIRLGVSCAYPAGASSFHRISAFLVWALIADCLACKNGRRAPRPSFFHRTHSGGSRFPPLPRITRMSPRLCPPCLVTGPRHHWGARSRTDVRHRPFFRSIASTVASRGKRAFRNSTPARLSALFASPKPCASGRTQAPTDPSQPARSLPLSIGQPTQAIRSHNPGASSPVTGNTYTSSAQRMVARRLNAL